MFKNLKIFASLVIFGPKKKTKTASLIKGFGAKFTEARGQQIYSTLSFVFLEEKTLNVSRYLNKIYSILVRGNRNLEVHICLS